MELLPAEQYQECKTNCWIAVAHHETHYAEKGTVIYADDYGLKLDVLEGIAANYESKATLKAKRES